MLLLTLAVATLSSPPAVPVVAESPKAVAGGHGKLPWFEGSFEAAIAKAKAENKLVFIDFWTSWCGWCKRMDKDTFSDDSVVLEMKDVLCLSIDAESQEGAPLAKRFGVRGFPALLLLGPDGTPEDNIGGYLPPEKFKQEIRRVRAGRDTVSGYRKQIAATPSDLESRFRLANKLNELGDRAGGEALMADIRRLDPQGASLPMRRLALDEVREKINAGFQKSMTVDTSLMEAFLAKETFPELLFEGWSGMVQMHDFMAQRAEQHGRLEDAEREKAGMRRALRTAWQHVPKERVADFGNSLAWTYYEARAQLIAEEKAFALEVAEKAVAAAGDDVNVIDTFACCLRMNGRLDEAAKQLQRCIELDPANQQWKDRLAELQR